MASFESFVFMGCKHCGKSTHGKAFAEKHGLIFFDIDDVIQRLVCMPVREYYSKKGATNFMLAEEDACRRVAAFAQKELAKGGKGIVVATGGGICDNPPALAALRSLTTFVFLKLHINTAVKRITDKIVEIQPGVFENVPAYICGPDGKAPATMEEITKRLVEKFTARTERYEKIADIVVKIKNAPVDDNFNTILRALN